MLANSSPVRDWESFADPKGPWRPVLSFRGASGIDGTLSIACGAAEALGDLVLVSGDLALLHDSNGWLWRRQLRGRLLVLLIDNRGGGIFEQLPIRTDPDTALDFERLFAMDPGLDACALAAAHGIPSRRAATAAALGEAIDWGLEQPLALVQISTDRQRDGAWRQQLRTMAAAMLQQP
jgi:2-succinyl-5-enolpyruvyl-6-hydroxy-3-cyclohexene-1-carboxylate synthase